MEGQAGAGVHYSQEQELVISLGKWATVYQSEVVAIEAATGLQGIGESNRDIKICSDSQASLKALAAPVVKSKQIYGCQAALQALAEHQQVELIWVPGHRGIEGNEAADRLAKEGSSRAMIGPEPALGISPKILRGEIYQYLRRAHKEYWEGLNTCRQAKELMGGLNKKRAKQLIRYPRNKLQPIVGVLTGHCGLNKHLTVINIRNDPLCQLCFEEEETAFHFLGECPAFSALRIKLLGVDTLTAGEIRNLPISELWRIIKESGRLKR
jgi:ribonuclease HI